MPTAASPPLTEGRRFFGTCFVIGANFIPDCKEQLEELREAFRIFDKNADGRITTSELADFLHALDKRPSDADVQSMLDGADTNHDGVLDFPEFAALMGARLTIAQAEDELGKVFAEFDLDRSGLIERGEMKAVLAKLGDKLSDEEIQLIIREVDMDGDGKVNFAEFTRMMQGKA
ncbi:calmodulin-like 3 [Ceratobasidium sp. 395]|nr:calmodulin-like 3 [Ceratobasidium sp. 395]